MLDIVDPQTAKYLVALEASNGERHMLSYFKQHPALLYRHSAPCRGHDDYVIAEFEIGNEYKVDFVVLNSYSGGWDISLIELEPVGAKLFNKDRTPARELRVAMRQLDDWRRFIRQQSDYFPTQLTKAAQQKDLLHPDYGRRDREPTSGTGWPLRDSRNAFSYSYQIVIGRRANLRPIDNELRATYRTEHRTDIATYDRFLPNRAPAHI
jgi:hypothetical protein